jgi:hypothetical protein
MSAQEVLGMPDVLMYHTRYEPEYLQTLRLVTSSWIPSVHQIALAVVAETKASFEHLLHSLPHIRLEELRELDYNYYADEGEEDVDSDAWQHAAPAFNEATSQLQAHQGVILRAQCLLECELCCIGFEPQARALMHAGALTLLDCAWDADRLQEAIGVENLPEEYGLDIANHSDWWVGELQMNGRVRCLVDTDQETADLQSMCARFGLANHRLDGFVRESWLSATISVSARERAGLAAPEGCYTLKQLAEEAPEVLDQALRAEWHSRHSAAAKMRPVSWLERGLRKLGLEARSDSARQRECVASLDTMEDKVAETLRSAVWMHWLHDHTQGRYTRAVNRLVYVLEDIDGERLLYPGKPRDEHEPRLIRWTGMEFREAVNLVQLRPEFQMPDTIPWLPAPENKTDDAVVEAARALRACIRWGRAFLRVRALVALCRPLPPRAFIMGRQ